MHICAFELKLVSIKRTFVRMHSYFEKSITSFTFKKCIEKCCLPNANPFVQASMFYDMCIHIFLYIPFLSQTSKDLAPGNDKLLSCVIRCIHILMIPLIAIDLLQTGHKIWRWMIWGCNPMGVISRMLVLVSHFKILEPIYWTYNIAC